MAGETEGGVKYPKSTFFIISNEFCERFSYYGMKTILSLYLSNALAYDTDTATVLYHLFAMLCYFFPLFGAILADSFLGKFRTILYLSFIYALGNVILSLAAIPVIQLPHRAISLLGLLFIAVGTGGIKPCVSSFGGDQFVLPEQELELQRFFSIFYFSINAGSMLSTLLTPELRKDVTCFGQDDCYPVAFGVPALLMFISVFVFLSGKRTYKIKPPTENVIVNFSKCVARAIINKITGKNNIKKKHWLEFADDKFSKQQILDIRAVFNVLYLFTPIPIFWALFDQQGSRWTFQATNMDGRIFGDYYIKPDQMQVLNPFLILSFIPLFEIVVYPFMKNFGIKRPLQKLVIGGFLAALAFGCSAYLESHVENSYGVAPISGTGNVRIFNTFNCILKIDPPIENASTISPLSSLDLLQAPVTFLKQYHITFSVEETCLEKVNHTGGIVDIMEKKDLSYFVSEKSGFLWINQPGIVDVLTKNQDGGILIRFFYTSPLNETVQVKFQNLENKQIVPKPEDKQIFANKNSSAEFFLFTTGRYDVMINDKVILHSFVLNPGEIDTMLISNTSGSMKINVINMAPSNKVHMLWQIPQIAIMTAGEIMFSVTGLEFSFTQAPESMKSVVSAAWLLTVAFGNLIVIIISELKFFNSQMYEFLLFTFLMVIDVFCLIYLSVRYKYINYSDMCDESPQTNSHSMKSWEPDSHMTSTTLDD